MNLSVTRRGFRRLLEYYDEILPPKRRIAFLAVPGWQEYHLEWRTASRDRCTAVLTIVGGKAMLTIRCADSRRFTYWPDETLLRRCGLIGEEGAECK